MSLFRFSFFFILIYARYLQCDEANVLNYVCEFTDKIFADKSETHDVAIGSFNAEMPSNIFNEVIKCISKHSIVTTTDFTMRVEERNLRKAHLTVILSNEFDQVSIKLPWVN